MMAQNPRYKLSMSGHHKNVCMELSSFQQNGEFVDMTLAADGHVVKVHQIVMAYASPYFKELIKSANCPHPVIFLNKLSYTSLCSILEYIYTGETNVSLDNMKDFIEASQGLNIRGLENLSLKGGNTTSNNIRSEHEEPHHSSDNNIMYAETLEKCHTLDADATDAEEQVTAMDDDHDDDDDDDCFDVSDPIEVPPPPLVPIKVESDKQPATVQYTVSNRGALQLILNRYTYFLQYTYKKDPKRSWRCVDCVRKRCPAYVITKDDMVVRRISAHNHPYHDRKILKKLHAGAIFSAIHEAQAMVLEATAAAAQAEEQADAESSDSAQSEDGNTQSVNATPSYTQSVNTTPVNPWPLSKKAENVAPGNASLENQTSAERFRVFGLEGLRIEDFRGDAKWYERDGHCYVAAKHRNTSITLRCALSRCPARWLQRRDTNLRPIVPDHNHKPHTWIRERNIMFSTLKRRCIEEDTPLNQMFHEEAARHVNAAPHLPYTSMMSSMRLWRRRAQPPAADVPHASFVPETHTLSDMETEVQSPTFSEAEF